MWRKEKLKKQLLRKKQQFDRVKVENLNNDNNSKELNEENEKKEE